MRVTQFKQACSGTTEHDIHVHAVITLECSHWLVLFGLCDITELPDQSAHRLITVISVVSHDL